MSLALPLHCHEVGGAPSALLDLLRRCLERPRCWYYIFAAYPADFPQQWKQDAAFFRWHNRGEPKQSIEEAHEEYLAALEELRLSHPCGLVLVHDTGEKIQIQAFVVPREYGCLDASNILRALIDSVVGFAHSRGSSEVECSIKDSDIQRILLEKYFCLQETVMRYSC